MPMTCDRRRALAETMRAVARANRCPVCGRHAAMIIRKNAEGCSQVFCRWIDLGKCPGDGHDISEVLGL